MRRAPLLAALSIAAIACHGATPSTSALPPVAEIPVEPIAPAHPVLVDTPLKDPSHDPPPRPTARPSHSPSTDSAEDATRERRVYRDLVTGLITRDSTRLTWVLSRGSTLARMRLLCQRANPGAFQRRLTGAENDEDAWGAPDIADYDGRLDAPLSYAFTVSPSDPSATPPSKVCVTLPPAFRLKCHPRTVSVLRAGAALIPGTGAKDVDVPIAARWDPPKLEPVEALSCDVLPIDAPPSAKKVSAEPGDERRASLEWGGFFVLSPVFAAATPARPGIEWAFENSDCVVQQGAFRFLPRAR